LDAFITWLCRSENEVVGYLGTWFHSPLARYLSEVTGHVCGVDGKRYGRALNDYRRWLLLPRWAELFTVLVESSPYRPVTGYETLLILAQIELALVPKRAR
jgi:hypothetical protein